MVGSQTWNFRESDLEFQCAEQRSLGINTPQRLREVVEKNAKQDESPYLNESSKSSILAT